MPDPRPQPPEKPLATDCCETGCDVCVFDAYIDALRAYERALANWLNANPCENPECSD
ncbi:MAG: oxidoreductase-like domain-containing protein [Salinisphaeraceae bacterium]|nr:oxidoreductase-like domain-containing protein [Salinisphaeraceae bacterium]